MAEHVEVVLCCAPMGTRKGGRLGKMARETQLNNIIRSLSDSYSPDDRATADLPYAVEAAFEAFEKAGVPFPNEPHEVKRILRQGAPTILREYQQLELGVQRHRILQALASLVDLKREELQGNTAPRPPARRSWAWLVVAAVVCGLGLLLFWLT